MASFELEPASKIGSRLFCWRYKYCRLQDLPFNLVWLDTRYLQVKDTTVTEFEECSCGLKSGDKSYAEEHFQLELVSVLPRRIRPDVLVASILPETLGEFWQLVSRVTWVALRIADSIVVCSKQNQVDMDNHCNLFGRRLLCDSQIQMLDLKE